MASITEIMGKAFGAFQRDPRSEHQLVLVAEQPTEWASEDEFMQYWRERDEDGNEWGEWYEHRPWLCDPDRPSMADLQ